LKLPTITCKSPVPPNKQINVILGQKQKQAGNKEQEEAQVHKNKRGVKEAGNSNPL
jgi:hypothetical protein